MFRYNGKKWVPFERKVSYTMRYEYFTDDDLIPDFPDVQVTEIALTDEQLARLEQVSHLEDMGIEAITKFVLTEALPEDNPAMVTRVTQEKERLEILKAIDVAKMDPAVLKTSSLSRNWEDVDYFTSGEPIVYNDVIYKVLQSHPKQSDWTPDVAVSLFAKVLTSPSGPLPWVQPGATNPYMKGDRVTFEGKTYESLIDGNVWSPTGYPAGWKVIV